MGVDYVPTMLERLHHAFVHVKENMHAARQRNKHYYDQKAAKLNFEVGDPVYFYYHSSMVGKTPKFVSPWQPFHRISEKLSPVHFRIHNQTTGNSKVVHVEHLRPAHPEATWDQQRTDYPLVYKDPHGRPNEAERIQPIRQAKLTLPSHILVANPLEFDNSLEPQPSTSGAGTGLGTETSESPAMDHEEIMDMQDEPNTQLSGSTIGASQTPSSHYNLRPWLGAPAGLSSFRKRQFEPDYVPPVKKDRKSVV
mgnify:CR=1 FL=1